jgi:uncharacterized protein (UPF0332 family)
MNPLDFLALADQLAADHSEASQRSAVSRAYYAAFNAAKALIESCGLRFPSTNEAHAKLPMCMAHSGDAELKVAEGKLHSLRQQRNGADYELDDPKFGKVALVALQLRIARQIADAIREAEARKPDFCPTVKAYAKSTLKMSFK